MNTAPSPCLRRLTSAAASLSLLSAVSCCSSAPARVDPPSLAQFDTLTETTTSELLGRLAPMVEGKDVWVVFTGVANVSNTPMTSARDDMNSAIRSAISRSQIFRQIDRSLLEGVLIQSQQDWVDLVTDQGKRELLEKLQRKDTYPDYLLLADFSGNTEWEGEDEVAKRFRLSLRLVRVDSMEIAAEDSAQVVNPPGYRFRS